MPSPAEVAARGIAWAEQRDFCGYAKGDALNSPLVRALAGRSRLLRSGANFLVERSPVHLRPLLGVRRLPSPKALALFLRASLVLHRLGAGPAHLERAHALAERLRALSQVGRPEVSGHCWGPEYPRSDPALGLDLYAPGAVVTAEVIEAFVDLALEAGDEVARGVAASAARFLERDLRVLERGAAGVCLSYVPDHDWKVVNANAKTACALARVGALLGDRELLELAEANMRWVVGRQTDEGAWYYADPPGSSHVAHDGYHTGFVLCSLGSYLEVSGDSRFAPEYERGLEFYARRLFLADGAPKWRSDRSHPMDVKGAAQGILCFSSAARRLPGYRDDAERIAAWVLANLWSPDGRFHYQRGRLTTKRWPLMRWCQAWSSFAFAALAEARARTS